MIEKLSFKKCLNKIRPCLKGIISNLKKSGAWKIQLTIAINFISSKDDNNEEHVMHSASDNIEIMIKGHLHYKLIISQNVLSEVQVKNFFIL